MSIQSPYTSYPSLKQRKVLITGGASGIGASMVEHFCRQASQVFFLDIDADAAAALIESMRSQGLSRPSYFHCDLRDIAALRQVISAIQSQFGSIDVLVNNAARDDRHSFMELEPEYWDEALQVNLRHQIFASQAVVQGMQAAGGGSIILFGSVAWMRGRPGFIGYTSAKAAINGATRTLARELGASRIRVNSILPGLILTDRAKALWFNPEQVERFIEQQSLKFPLEPADVARMALFLAADDSRGCTGQNFIIDAGVS